MSSIAAPADRRFRRAHVKPARARRKWIGRIKPLVRYTLVGLLVAYAVYRGSGVVAHARMLQIDRIVVGGNQRLSQDDVLTALGGLRGENLVWVDLDRWRQRLLASPWVRDAAFRRSLPSTVEVLVWEREPIGLGRVNGDLYLVDDGGAIIDQYGPQYADLDLPIVDGLAVSVSQEKPTTDRARAELAARVIDALKAQPEVARRLSQIDVSNLHDVAVILSGDPAVIELGDDQFLARLQSYLEVAPSVHERVAEIDHVDVRFDHRIYVRPAGKRPKTAESKAAPASGVARKTR